MSKCKCGCGADAPEGKEYMRGHNLNQKKKEQPKPEETKQAEEPRILVSNIRACGIKSDNVAWFKTVEGYISKELEFYCTLIHENNNEQCDYVAVVLEDGSIMPAVLLPGFSGVYSRHQEPKEQEKEEINPSQLEIMDSQPKPLPTEQKPVVAQPDEPKDDGLGELRAMLDAKPPEKKQGWIDKFIHGTPG